MNILQRNFLHQITFRTEVIHRVYLIQSLQIHRSQNANSLHSMANTKWIRPILTQYTMKTPSNRWFSSEATSSRFLFVRKWFKPFQKMKSVIGGRSVLLYGKGVDEINHKEFVQKFQMPDTFNTWFLITEIHVWMLLVRAMAERENAVLIRNNIVKELWSDVWLRAKTLAPGETKKVKKQIEELSHQFHYAIVSYDEGLTKDDKQLASAVWNRFFTTNCENYEHIELIVKYIRYNISTLDKMSSEDFLTKRAIRWPSLKQFENTKL